MTSRPCRNDGLAEFKTDELFASEGLLLGRTTSRRLHRRPDGHGQLYGPLVTR